jgi:hypothetical protein
MYKGDAWRAKGAGANAVAEPTTRAEMRRFPYFTMVAVFI